MTEEEYLERERAAEFKSDYYAGYVYNTAGASWIHATIIQNLSWLLHTALKGRNCSVRTSDIRVRVSGGLYTYPDVLAVCGEPKFHDNRSDTITNPILIVEVLSPSTEAYDRGAKASQYRAMESLQELVIVVQLEPRVEIYRKRSNEWVLSEAAGLESTCRLASVDCEFPLGAIYDQVTFTPGLL
jgi:Uma2 family endonuclease